MGQAGDALTQSRDDNLHEVNTFLVWSHNISPLIDSSNKEITSEEIQFEIIINIQKNEIQPRSRVLDGFEFFKFLNFPFHLKTFL